MSRRQPGDPALLRHVYGPHVASALPVTVVEDTDDRTVLWLREGTDIRWIATPDLPTWLDAGRPMVAKTWTDTHALLCTDAGCASSVWPMWWAATGAWLGWYVNLQEPLRPTAHGWDTSDQELDILVGTDGSWQWKDVEAFEERVARGLLSPAEADSVRREGERVLEDLAAARYPFDRDWSGWHPDPAWVRPTLPVDWDAVGA